MTNLQAQLMMKYSTNIYIRESNGALNMLLGVCPQCSFCLRYHFEYLFASNKTLVNMLSDIDNYTETDRQTNTQACAFFSFKKNTDRKPRLQLGKSFLYFIFKEFILFYFFISFFFSVKQRRSWHNRVPKGS